jgi:peptide/nickel transport system substrate-binding protein
MTRFGATIAALAIGITISAGRPAVAENVLRFMGTDATASTMDPHANADKDNKAATKQVYEQLLDVDSNLAIVPQLALAWKPLNPTTWEFELRPGCALPRRHAIHRRGRGLQHRARQR